MRRRSTTIVFSLFITMGLACSLSPSPGVPRGPGTPNAQPTASSPGRPTPNSPQTSSSPSAVEAAKAVTDIILEISYSEGSSSSGWDSGPGCVPKYRDTGAGMPTQAPPNETHLKVAQDGTLEGTCYFSTEGSNSLSTGKVSGNIDWASGKITFHLEGKDEALYQGVTTVSTLILDATGDVTSGDQASGEAAWSGTCRAAASGGLTCGLLDTPQELSVDMTGSCPWKMWFVRN